MNAVGNYFETLVQRFGSWWNAYWFTPADTRGVSMLRPLTGVMALWFVLSFTSDLITWFAPDGLLPLSAVEQLTRDEDRNWNNRLSYLNLIEDAAALQIIHFAGVAVVAAYTLGLATRITSVLTLAVVLSYIHRAPMITGQFEPVLTLLLFYLCFAPCGRHYSLDRWLAKKRGKVFDSENSSASLAANISIRLIQVHVALMYLMMGLTKLGGSDVWWGGEAMWYLAAHTESRLIDLTFLHRNEYLFNLWTHAVVLFELLFAAFIWNPLARPLLLAFAVIHWVLLGLVTGLLSFSLIMLIANLSYVDLARLSGNSTLKK